MVTLQKIRLKKSISSEALAMLGFVFYFSSSSIRVLLNWIFGIGSLSTTIAVFVIYFPLLLACVIDSRNYIKYDFMVLLICILMFFLATLVMHPEYVPFYLKDEIGVWDYVFVPYRGIYSYLFVRLFKEPKKITKCFKISGWIMFSYFGYQLLLFIRNGFWYGVRGLDGKAKLTYNVSFGYDVLFFALIFLYEALKKKKAPDILAAVICVLMIFAGGSRGPVLFIGIFLILYVFLELKNARKKMKLAMVAGTVAIFIYAFYNIILGMISYIISNMGFSSRFINKLLSNSISTDNGRWRLWDVAIQMIKKNPMGYGAMGSRHVFSKYIYSGYPHSIILEFLIDYGVFIGSLLLIILACSVVFMLFSTENSEWLDVFLPLLCTSGALFISLTYWSLPAFWSSLGICVNCISKRKNVIRPI